MSSMTTLKLVEGNEFKIRIEDVTEFSESFFKDIYNSAAKNVEDIISNTEKYHNTESNKSDKSLISNKNFEEYNNVIAFIGDRGSGKSSAMVSFSEALRNLKFEKNKNFVSGSNLDHYKKISNYNFECLDIVDPTLFEGNESIFEVIIAKMFAKFKKFHEENDKDIDLNDKKRVLKGFQRVYTDLKTINSGRSELYNKDVQSENIIETLEMLASGSNMRKNFINLVQDCLNLFVGKSISDKSKSFLVISIDDLDMNLGHAANMAEQIRKYLLVPNVIILMAVKIEQLSLELEQEYRSHFDQVMINNFPDPKEMAVKYLEKLFPNGRKLFLPQIKAFSDGKGDIIGLKYVKKYSEEQPLYLYKEFTDKDGNVRFPSIQETVLGLTSEKTGLIFLKPQYNIHYLVPNNLRELHNYLSMLIDLNSNDKEANLIKFESYFRNTWIKNNLSSEYITIIETLCNTDIRLKNKYVVKCINQIINTYNISGSQIEMLLFKEAEVKLKDFLNETISLRIANPEDISIGDVLSLLKLWNDYDDSENSMKLSFAIKTIYSIILYRLLVLETDTGLMNIKSKNNYKNICSIIGGDLFGVLGSSFIRKDRGTFTFTRYDELPVGDNTIGNALTSIFDYFSNSKEKQDSIEDNKDYKKNSESLQLIELIHYFTYIGKDETELKYKNPVRILGNIGVTKNATFNVNAFLFILLNPEKNLERIFSHAIENYCVSKKVTLNIKERLYQTINNNSLIGSVRNWQKDNKLTYPIAVPMYSLEFLEYILNRMENLYDFKLKDEAPNTYRYINQYFKRFTDLVDEIIENHPFLNAEKMLIANNINNFYDVKAVWESCPIKDLIMKQKNNLSIKNFITVIDFMEENRTDLGKEEQSDDLKWLKKTYDEFSFNHMSNVNRMIRKVRNITQHNYLNSLKVAPMIEKLNDVISSKMDPSLFDGSRSDRDTIESTIKTILSEGIKQYNLENING